MMFGKDVDETKPKRAPMPDMPPIRTFKIITMGFPSESPVVTVIDGHNVDFTTAGGIFVTRMVPEYAALNGEEGWVVMKRYVRGFACYESFEEIFTVPSSLTLH